MAAQKASTASYHNLLVRPIRHGRSLDSLEDCRLNHLTQYMTNRDVTLLDELSNPARHAYCNISRFSDLATVFTRQRYGFNCFCARGVKCGDHVLRISAGA